LLIVTLAGAALYFVTAAVTIPHGTWDAWSIWNARARFFFRGYPGFWMEAFSPALNWSHLDYPLLVPLSVARAWTYIGGEHITVPIVLAGTFCTAIVTTAAKSVGRSTTAWRGVLTAAMILASPAFLAYSATQCADIPLAFYVLTTCVLIGSATESGSSPAWWAVAGVAAGLAAWTKNEGMAFAAIVFVVCTAWTYRTDGWRGLTRVALMFAGAAPILAVLVVFKLFFAPPNDLVAAQSIGHVVSNLSDVHRLEIVAAAVARELWFGKASVVGVLPLLAMFVLATGIRRPIPTGAILGLTISAAVIAVDILVYILTPQDLVWHLATSVQRVVLQIFPVIVWCGMSLADERRGAAMADGRARVRAEEPGLAASTPGF
jgi:4-amino-4-deoxy-L-arabinose transferase-like glycosyltransferase